MHDMENSSQQSVAGNQQPFMDDGSATLVPYFQTESVIFYLGDSLAVLPSLAENSMDACVTDPPYELGFMGKAWDNSGIAYNVDLWRLVFRALKPGAHLLAFGGSRTYHRMACAIEDAGFEIRDQIQWIYGSGFPKSLDVSKAIDKAAGAEREVYLRVPRRAKNVDGPSKIGQADRATEFKYSHPASAASAAWDGWGTALKPAHEPIVMARKPLEKGLTVAQNVLKWGTGAINVDKCRIEIDERSNSDFRQSGAKNVNHMPLPNQPKEERGRSAVDNHSDLSLRHNAAGRFPANVIHDGSDEVLAGFPQTTSGQLLTHHRRSGSAPIGTFEIRDRTGEPCDFGGDTGSAARFFYSPKASKYDREAGLREAGLREAARPTMGNGIGGQPNQQVENNRNIHPTVKPFDLMQYLCRLVTPPGGTILEPFLGSGSTAKAATSALIDGFKVVGIELNEDYMQIAQARFNGTPMRLF